MSLSSSVANSQFKGNSISNSNNINVTISGTVYALKIGQFPVCPSSVLATDNQGDKRGSWEPRTGQETLKNLPGKALKLPRTYSVRGNPKLDVSSRLQRGTTRRNSQTVSAGDTSLST